MVLTHRSTRDGAPTAVVGLDDTGRAEWLTRKAALLDGIASAAAHPSLAVEGCLPGPRGPGRGPGNPQHPCMRVREHRADRELLMTHTTPVTPVTPATSRGTAPSSTTMTPGGYALAAAEAIRGLNHATLAPGGYVWPNDVDTVVAALELMVERLPQALAQAQIWLLAARDAGRVGQNPETAGGPIDVAEAVAIAWNHLRHATTYANWTRQALHLAHAETCHLTGLASDPAACSTDDSVDSDDVAGPRTGGAW